MDGSVDVVLLTKDSQRVLRACVESIYQNIPVGQLSAKPSSLGIHA